MVTFPARLKYKVTIAQDETIPNIWYDTMFGDLDWPLNASRWFVSISWASCYQRDARHSASLPSCGVCDFRLKSPFLSETIWDRLINVNQTFSGPYGGLSFARTMRPGLMRIIPQNFIAISSVVWTQSTRVTNRQTGSGDTGNIDSNMIT